MDLERTQTLSPQYVAFPSQGIRRTKFPWEGLAQARGTGWHPASPGRCSRGRGVGPSQLPSEQEAHQSFTSWSPCPASLRQPGWAAWCA